MRLIPLITAVLVCFALYLIIFQREALLAFANDTEVATDQPQPVEIPLEEKPPVSVVALTSTAQPVTSGVILRGQTEAARSVEVRSEISGLVISEPLRKGTQVEQGQLLCELDSGTRLAQLAEAKARLVEATTNEQASSSLVRKGFASETQVISRKAALESAQANVEKAEKEIARLKIKAPFSGLLETDVTELGSLMQPGSLCATVVALDPIKLVGFAAEDKINLLSLGTDAGAELVTGETVYGKVTFLSRKSDPLTRTYRVEIKVPNPDQSIRDGATAEIFIALAGENGHLLPQSSLTLDDDGRLGVRLVRDAKAYFHPVTLIRDVAEGVWVTGLPDTVEVIVIGQEFVTDGRRVTVSQAKEAS